MRIGCPGPFDLGFYQPLLFSIAITLNVDSISNQRPGGSDRIVDGNDRSRGAVTLAKFQEAVT